MAVEVERSFQVLRIRIASDRKLVGDVEVVVDGEVVNGEGPDLKVSVDAHVLLDEEVGDSDIVGSAGSGVVRIDGGARGCVSHTGHDGAKWRAGYT